MPGMQSDSWDGAREESGQCESGWSGGSDFKGRGMYFEYAPGTRNSGESG